MPHPLVLLPTLQVAKESSAPQWARLARHLLDAAAAGRVGDQGAAVQPLLSCPACRSC